MGFRSRLNLQMRPAFYYQHWYGLSISQQLFGNGSIHYAVVVLIRRWMNDKDGWDEQRRFRYTIYFVFSTNWKGEKSYLKYFTDMYYALLSWAS